MLHARMLPNAVGDSCAVIAKFQVENWEGHMDDDVFMGIDPK